jgi:hypothetical protein
VVLLASTCINAKIWEFEMEWTEERRDQKKHPYSRPQLVRFGDVHKLTRSTTTTGNKDGASGSPQRSL